MHWLDSFKENLHLLAGGAFSFFIYQEKINQMTTGERLFYVALSVTCGFYGGNALNELAGLSLSSSRAHLITILTTIFGLAILGIARDNLAAIFDTLKKKWIG